MKRSVKVQRNNYHCQGASPYRTITEVTTKTFVSSNKRWALWGATTLESSQVALGFAERFCKQQKSYTFTLNCILKLILSVIVRNGEARTFIYKSISSSSSFLVHFTLIVRNVSTPLITIKRASRYTRVWSSRDEFKMRSQSHKDDRQNRNVSDNFSNSAT